MSDKEEEWDDDWSHARVVTWNQEQTRHLRDRLGGTLVAFCDDALTDEAARRLVEMAEDTSRPGSVGEDLPLADKAALLLKLNGETK